MPQKCEILLPYVGNIVIFSMTNDTCPF